MKTTNNTPLNRMVTFFMFTFLIIQPFFSQIPPGYYDAANGKTGYELKTALKSIITNGHTDQGYDALYTLYQNADVDSYYENDGTLLDMYSEIPNGPDSYEYNQTGDKCGTYSNEGDCYNREHLVPQSVFSSAAPMKNDGHFVVPADGKVNGQRSNYAFGIVSNPTWTSTNGSKVGTNSTAGYSGTVFEPIDEFKGDIARMLFYFATRYEDQVASWSHPMLNGTSDQVFSDWFLDILLQWDANDPVSQREKDRNEAVYNFQGNRNPYIDHPEWVNEVWGNSSNNNSGNTPGANEIIAIQDFDGTTPNWSYTQNSGSYSCFTTGTNYQNNATTSMRINGTNSHNVDPYLDFANIDISSFTDVNLSVYFAANGPDSGDDLWLDISYDNGLNWTSTKLVDGYGNADLNFGDTNASNPTTVSQNPYVVNIPNSETQIKIKLRFDERSSKNNTSDYYYVDDIKLTGTTSSSNDADAYATSGTQPAAGTIDSMNDTAAEAIDVFVMDIYDQGTADGLDTNITNIRIKPYNTNNADWTDNIQGFVISDGTNTITPASVDITDTYIDFVFNSGDLIIPDNDLIELTFSVYLNTSNIQDGAILSFMVDADDHGFTADSNGTEFEATFEDGDFHSNDYTIDVTLSKLNFEQQPTNVEVAQVMTPAVTVIAIDDNGNIDIDFDGSGAAVGLTTTGSFDASATTQVDAVQGVATFDNLVFDTAATNITLTTTDPDNWGYTNATSNTFDVTAPVAGCSQLFISEYGEPSSGNGKYIEIYNPTGSTIDLSNYELWKISNGGNWPETTFSLSGTIGAYDVWVVGNNTTDVPDADQISSSICSFNGDDAVGLAYNGGSGSTFSLIDAVGTDGADPGSGWNVAGVNNATKDHTLIRKNTVDRPNTDWSASAGTNTSDSEWQVLSYSQDDLGNHSSNCAPASPEIQVEGNATEIISGDTTPSIDDDTEFGTITIDTASDHTFTIKNTGNADLNLTDSPIVSISGDAAFSIQTQPVNSTITAGGSETFVVHFAPTTTATVTATISIANNDSDENPYTFVVQGTGSYSNETDIISNANEALTVSSLVNDVNINSTSDGVEVWQFTIRDGGADLTDDDTVGTTLTNITITQAIGNSMNDWNDAILACALFDGTTKIGDATSITTNQIQFSGLNFNVPDDSAKTLSLRISIQPSPNDSGNNLDGDDFQFQISNTNVTADANGSQFNSFSSAKSENGKNVFEVIATQLVFKIQPSDIGVNSIMIPAPQVAAEDINGNIDLDFNNDITITSTGTMTNDPITVTATNGVADFNNVVHTVIGTGFTLTASSSGLPDVVSNTFDVLEQTILNPGDLAILAVNTNLGNGEDQIAFVCMKDITPGTKIYLTDNGYEREFAGQWGGTEGVISITRTNSTLPKGTIITFESTKGNVTNPSDFDIWTCGSIDTNWTKTALSGSGIGGFNLNSDDDVWILQGGTWTNDTSHHSTYDGNVLYGWTESGWDAGVGNGTNGTKWSNLFPGSDCFTTVAPVGDGKVKFNDPNDPDFSTTTNDRLDWIAEINTTGNWDTYNSNSDYNSTGFDYKGDTNCPQMTIAASTHTAGKWTGNDSSNWFDCSNWDTMTVPDANTNTVIPSSAINPPVIDATASDADLYNNIAQTFDLNIQDGLWIELNNVADILEVHGDLSIDNNAMLVMNDGDNTTDDGHLYLYGNWTNNYGDDGLDQGNGTVHLVGTALQTITGNAPDDTEEFYNLEINNPAGVNFTSGNIHAENDLTITAATPYDITDGHYILAGHDLVNNTNITIENQASLVQTDDAGSISGSGTFTLKKTSLPLDNYWEYVYWSSPINSSTFTLGDIVSNAWRYYKFDPNEANNGHTYPGWVMLSAADIPQKGVGYAVSAPNGAANNTILSPVFVKGSDPFNNGIINVPILKKGGPDNVGNYNLVGNPYPSAIDFDTLANDADNDDIADSYSLWTNCAGLDANGHHQPSGYTTYVVSGTATKACSNQAEAGRYIATGQGFMVEALNDNGTITFKNAYRVTGNNDGFLNRPAQTNDRDVLWLDLTDDTGNFSQIATGFYDGATTGFDISFDAHSLNTGSGFALYSLIPNQADKLVIQGLARQDISNQTVPLGIELATAQQVKFHLNHLQNFDNYDIYLKDNTLNTTHDLKVSDYIVNVDAGTDNNRFELEFNSTTGIDENALTDDNLVLTQNQGLFNLILKGDDKINKIQIYNLQGQLLYQKSDLSESQLQVNLQSVAKGNLLLFKVFTGNGRYYIKKALKQ